MRERGSPWRAGREDRHPHAEPPVFNSTVVFAEFDDRYRPKPTIPFWKGLAKEHRFTFVADRYVLPWVYWNLILKGRA